MSSLHICPECGKWFEEKKQRCTCGWQRQPSRTTPCVDHRCQYQSNGHRCPLPGTMSPHPYGSTRYCSGHWQCIGDPRLGDAVLLDAEKNYHALLEKRRDWRDRLFDEKDKVPC